MKISLGYNIIIKNCQRPRRGYYSYLF